MWVLHTKGVLESREICKATQKEEKEGKLDRGNIC